MTDQRTNNGTFCILIPLILGIAALTALYLYSKANKAESIQNDLSYKSNELLKEKQVGGVVVNMDGRDALLTGTVVSQDRSSEIENIVSSLNGIRIVDNQLEVVEPAIVEPSPQLVPEPKPEPAPEPAPEPEPEPTPEPIAAVIETPVEQQEAEVVEELLQTLDLSGITFKFGSNEITPEGKLILDEVVTVLTEHTQFNVAIEGHTDSVGGENLNQQLSQLRAQAVLDYVTNSGIQAERLTAEGFGESLPIYDNDTAQGRALNRRIEFNVTPTQ
jgi:outer membrane protein OmpA-like peptidoglycan-associated protein